MWDCPAERITFTLNHTLEQSDGPITHFMGKRIPSAGVDWVEGQEKVLCSFNICLALNAIIPYPEW